MGVVEKFYTADVLTVYCAYLPKIINVSLNLPKLLLKKTTGRFFVDAVYYIEKQFTVYLIL